MILIIVTYFMSNYFFLISQVIEQIHIEHLMFARGSVCPEISLEITSIQMVIPSLGLKGKSVEREQNFHPQAIAMITDQKNEQTLPKDIEIEG